MQRKYDSLTLFYEGGEVDHYSDAFDDAGVCDEDNDEDGMS